MVLAGENIDNNAAECIQMDNISQISADSEPLPEFIDVIQQGHIWEAGAAMFAEYCEFSTIHGVRYLGERKRSWKEKIFWIIVFSISIYICFYLISDLWVKWITMPVIISFSDKSTQIWKIPFPTFTICPDIKSDITVFDFSEFENITRTNVFQWSEQEVNFLDISLQICDYTDNSILSSKKIYFGNFIKDLQRLAPKVDSLFKNVTFNNKEEKWNIYMDPVITEMGLCYSFNMIPLDFIYRVENIHADLLMPLKANRSSKRTVQKNFQENPIKAAESFPYRSYNSFFMNGFSADAFGKIKDIDPICSAGDEGFKIAISTPGDIPQLSKQFYSVPFNHEILIDITPELITTSSSAGKYAPQFRRCFYPEERYLRFFILYSKENCELECIANYTLQKCGCTRFNMPRDQFTAACGAGNINCYLEAKRELMENEFQNILDNTTNYNIPDCKCLPSCSSLTYSVGISQAPLDTQKYENDGVKLTTFQVYFKDSRFWSLRRTKLYGVIEFTADAGGLLGLFMGISLLSFVEFFYFFSVRLCGNLHLRYCSNLRNRVTSIRNRLSYKEANTNETPATESNESL